MIQLKISPYLLVLIVAFSALTSSLHAKLELASPFADRMILQREQVVPVWGWADPGVAVKVIFGTQVKATTVNSEGQWSVQLEPLKASFESATLTVQSSKGERLVLNDVLVGEVWICSGQSNMAMRAGSVPEVRALIPGMQNIRSFQVENTVAFEPQERLKGQWAMEHPNSAVAASFAYFLEAHAAVPVGIILTSWGSSSIEGWMPRDMTAQLPHFEDTMNDFDANTKLQEEIKSILAKGETREKREDVRLRTQPNILYNAMMHPLIPFACRGLVWYQGEANSQTLLDMQQYGVSLPLWVERYRDAWANPEMHFLAVMLPGYGKLFRDSINPEDPTIVSWAYMREAQLKLLNLPNAGVVNTIDLGDISNVHPKDKLPIGERLALLAARDTPGMEIVAQGPVIQSVRARDGHLIAYFQNAEGLKTVDGEAPKAFWIADASLEWTPAEATIKGNTVVLRSSVVDEPLYLRYAFSGMPNVNLVNGAGLPAYPFRNDSAQP